MTVPFLPGVGSVMSADVAVPDHEHEVRFYARILPTGETPLWRGDLMNNLGLPVIRLGAESPEYAWLDLTVADLAESLCRVEEEGGSVVKVTRGSEGDVTYAVVRDPIGLHFALVAG